MLTIGPGQAPDVYDRAYVVRVLDEVVAHVMRVVGEGLEEGVAARL